MEEGEGKRGGGEAGERDSFRGTHRYADRNGRKFVCPRAFSKEGYFGDGTREEFQSFFEILQK